MNGFQASRRSVDCLPTTFPAVQTTVRTTGPSQGTLAYEQRLVLYATRGGADASGTALP